MEEIIEKFYKGNIVCYKDDEIKTIYSNKLFYYDELKRRVINLENGEVFPVYTVEQFVRKEIPENKYFVNLIKSLMELQEEGKGNIHKIFERLYEGNISYLMQGEINTFEGKQLFYYDEKHPTRTINLNAGEVMKIYTIEDFVNKMIPENYPFANLIKSLKEIGTNRNEKRIK